MNDENRIRTLAFAITARFEGGGYSSFQSYDGAVISYGRFQFTLASGALGRIVEQYLAQSNTQTAAALQVYLPRLRQRDESLRANKTLRDLLIEAGREPVMQQIQDETATQAYWEPIKRVAIQPRGLETPLAWALLFDIGIHFGVGDGFLRMAEREFGVPVRSRVGENGISETQLITRVAELRKRSHEQQARRDNLPGLRERADFWVNLIREGDWQLMGDRSGHILVRGQPIPVGRSDTDRPQPTLGELDPAKLYLAATSDRVRVRTQPVSGDTLAFVSTGQIVEVLELTSSALQKVGVRGQWLHVRTQEGIEGYTAAWFYTYYRKPTVEPPQPEPVPSPAVPVEPALRVTPIENRVRIRTRPVDGTSITTASLGDILDVLESPDEARQKLGIRDQWLRVRTAAGVEGYTAAWYYRDADAPLPESPVIPDPEPVPVPVPVPEPTNSLLAVTPIEDRIRVRAHPINGPSVAIVSLGDVLQVLEPREDALNKIGKNNQWLHVCAPDGSEGYTAAWFYTLYENVSRQPRPAPVPTTPAQPLYVIPVENNLRVRAQPVDGTTLQVVWTSDVLQVLEHPDQAREKIGVENQWLHIRVLDGPEGFVAAWLVKSFTDSLPSRQPHGNPTGVNLDIFHPLGRPSPNRLGKIGWIRLPYNVSLNPDRPPHDPRRYGNTDLDAVYRRYQPVLEQYARAGKKVLLVLNHQTFGEGAGYHWENMDAGQWRDLAAKFAAMAGIIASQYRGKNIVHVYQIWNEMDMPPGARASVSMPPEVYADLLTRTIRAIRAADPHVQIITGGHVSGPGSGSQYARQTIQAMPGDTRPDGIAFHPYGRGPATCDPRYRHFGLIDESIKAYASILPGRPVWITEWGVLDVPNESPEDIAHYTREFIGYLKANHARRVAAAMWFAWAQGMDNGYGLVDAYDRPRGILTESYINL